MSQIPLLILTAAVFFGATQSAAAADPTVMCNPGPLSIPMEKCYPLRYYVADYPWTPAFPPFPRDKPAECPRISTTPGQQRLLAETTPPVSLCVPRTMAPPYPTLSCTLVVDPEVPSRRVLGCAAFPTSALLQYHWTTTGAAIPIYYNDPMSHTAEFGCAGSGNGTVHVTITAPSGQQSGTSIGVSCSSPPVHP